MCVFLYSEADHTCSSDLLMGPDISYEALRGLQPRDNLCFCPESEKDITQSIIHGRAPSTLSPVLSSVAGVGVVGIHPRGGPAWRHLCQWLPVSSARERFVLAASVDRLSNSHREASSALTQKSRARLVLQDVLYFPCTRNMWIVDKKEA